MKSIINSRNDKNWYIIHKIIEQRNSLYNHEADPVNQNFINLRCKTQIPFTSLIDTDEQLLLLNIILPK